MILPVDPTALIFIKFFVVITCVCFWLRLAVKHLLRRHGVGSYWHGRHRH